VAVKPGPKPAGTIIFSTLAYPEYWRVGKQADENIFSQQYSSYLRLNLPGYNLSDQIGRYWLIS